ncbi:MAG: hypothetical protein ACXADW_19465 [Candidatus Hodarchaeales archaeon]|jgi:DMSO reductase anchor subunit
MRKASNKQMNPRVRLATYLVSSILISMLFLFLLSMLNAQLFLRNVHHEAIFQKIHELEALNPNILSEEKIDIGLVDIKWPWYALVFFYGIFLTYWFYFGKFFRKLLNAGLWNYSLIVPAITGILFGDIMTPVYILSCFFGSKNAFRPHESTSITV